MTSFKDLKQGSPVYILHKTGDISVTQGKVSAIGIPHVPMGSQYPMPLPGSQQTQTLVVDVTIEDNGQSKTYVIPDNQCVTYAGQETVIATEREGILREVECMKSAAEDELGRAERRKAEISQCESILAEWNPVFKEKRANEERFGRLETQMNSLTEMIQRVVNKLS